ncbi:cytochrome P450 [Nocardia anaemiae]|uniref:cytochrome P450 n=1 Tax=Nocardia anaemiae TaxID=263910 RepID=UPI0007A438E1|nr:cytochrome P450 [Nocardia anaemiae]
MAAEFPFLRLTSNQLTYSERDEGYRLLHARPEPSRRHDSGLCLVWRYDDVRELLEAAAPEISNAQSLRPLVGFGRIAANPRAVGHLCRHLLPPPAKATADLTDDVLHRRVWACMAGPTGYFTVHADTRSERVEALAEHFRQSLPVPGEVTEPLDVTAVSITYAARVIGEIVGLPQRDWPAVAEWSGAQSGLLGRWMRGRELADAVGALGRLFTVSGLAVAHSRQHGTGFPGHLRAAGIPPRVAVSAVANSLAAGVHTVSGSIQQGMQRLLGDPDRQWWQLLGEPAGPTRVAAKVLQLDPGLVGWKRNILRPIVLRSGTRLPKGPVLVMFGAANRDPRAFADPLAMDSAGKMPLTFGFGRHTCPGKQLAQLAVEVFLRELHSRAPHARLVDPARSPRSRPADLLFSGADIVIR